MKATIQIDPAIQEPEVIIKTNQITPEIEHLLQQLEQPLTLPARNKTGQWQLIHPKDILKIWSEDKHVLARTETETLYLQEPLARLEPKLTPHHFIRISNSELINIAQTRNFDLSMTGTILVTLKNNETCYVSRRKVAAIKELLKEGKL